MKETEEWEENERIPKYGTAEEMNEDKDNMERIENNQQTGDEDKTDKQGEQRMKELFHGIRGSLKEIRLTPRTQLKVILSQGKRTLEYRYKKRNGENKERKERRRKRQIERSKKYGEGKQERIIEDKEYRDVEM